LEGGSQVILHAKNVANEATTSNQSEYSGLLCSLNYLKGLLDRMNGRKFGVPITIYSKNQVLVCQVNGVDKVKAEGLVQYNQMAVQLLGTVGATVQHASKAQIDGSF
jgi:ribonuclease HI